MLAFYPEEPTMKLAPMLLAVATLTIAGSTAALAYTSPINVDKHGVALHGYDPVTYFELDKPQKGSEKIALSYFGVRWYFVSAENRKKFLHSRGKLIPEYGGYCANAVSENKLADVDPLAYKLVDGKLYLNSDMRVQKIWEQDVSGHISKADEYWPTLRPRL
jgi:hypothetical protein